MFSISSFTAGFVTGFGTGFISRELASTGTTVFRPMVKGTMKTAVALFQKGRNALANMGESFEDLVAEVRSELSQQREPEIEEAIITTIEVEEGIPERPTRSKQERKKEQRS